MDIKEQFHPPTHQVPLAPCDLSVLTLLGQQRALRLDQVPPFLSLFEGTWRKAQSATLKSTAHNIVERLQRAGLVRMQRFGNHDPGWVWLTKEGQRHLGISSSWKRPARSMLPTLYAANAIRLALTEQYPQASWLSRQPLRMEDEAQGHLPLSTAPTAEVDTGTGELVAIHVILRLTGKEEQIAACMREQLQREMSPGKPYYTALWYYATPEAAQRLRAARRQIAKAMTKEVANTIWIFSYPLVKSVNSFAWSPESTQLVSGSTDGAVHLYQMSGSRQ